MSFNASRDQTQLQLVWAPLRAQAEHMLRIMQGWLRERPTEQEKVEVHVASTWRDPAEQMVLFQRGRTRVNGAWFVENPKQIVTKAPPEETAHCCLTADGKPASLAVDFVILVDGKWAEDRDPRWALIPAAAALVNAEELEPGAFWNEPRDWPHVEVRHWRTHAERRPKS